MQCVLKRPTALVYLKWDLACGVRLVWRVSSDCFGACYVRSFRRLLGSPVLGIIHIRYLVFCSVILDGAQNAGMCVHNNKAKVP